MCISQPKAPINKANYALEDGYKQATTIIGPEEKVKDRPYDDNTLTKNAVGKTIRM